MAYEKEVTSKTNIDFIFDELQVVFFDFLDKFKKLVLKIKSLKKI